MKKLLAAAVALALCACVGDCPTPIVVLAFTVLNHTGGGDIPMEGATITATCVFKGGSEARNIQGVTDKDGHYTAPIANDACTPPTGGPLADQLDRCTATATKTNVPSVSADLSGADLDAQANGTQSGAKKVPVTLLMNP